jgi:flagellar hook-associated protein 2
MASLSVDGLISGLDTTSLIAQLVQAEALPQARLKNQLTTTQNAATAYRSINTKVDALRSAAEELAKTTTWGSAKATSSSPNVAVAVTGTPQTGQLSFTVESLAAAQSSISDTRWDTAATPFGSSALTITSGGATTTISVGGTGTLADAVSAINASKAGVTATAVKLDDGKYGLLVNARKTGVANGFTVGGMGTFTSLSTAADARVRLGSSTGPAVSSSSNTFTDLLPGGTITVNEKAANPITINVAGDVEAVATKVRNFVDAVNAALTEINKHSNNQPGSTAVLKGDSPLRQLTSQLLTAISDVVGSTATSTTDSIRSAGLAGVELTRDGMVTFDKTAFLAKLESAPEATQRLFAGTPANGAAAAVDGLSQRIQTLTKDATNATTGTLVSLAKGREDLVKDIKKRIEAWDLRLAARKEALTRQFSAMETALSSLKNQSSWLAGQLG